MKQLVLRATVADADGAKDNMLAIGRANCLKDEAEMSAVEKAALEDEYKDKDEDITTLRPTQTLWDINLLMLWKR